MCILKYMPLTGTPPAENFAYTKGVNRDTKRKEKYAFIFFIWLISASFAGILYQYYLKVKKTRTNTSETIKRVYICNRK